MGSRTNDVYLENRSQVRVRTMQLRQFAGDVRRALRLKGGVALLVCNDREIRRMNQWFRGKDYATDVLSFPSDVPGHAGDLAISAQMAAKSARRYKLTLTDEMKVLVLHGMLHLAGFDHEADAGEMQAKETILRKRFKLPPSLTERASAPTRKFTRGRGR
jgi:probable rRNA maturation factor